MHARNLIVGVIVSLLATAAAHAQLVPIDNGRIVQDGQLDWLSNANLAADPTIRATLNGLYHNLPTCSAALPAGCINPNGSMDYPTATALVQDLNAYNYLGHNTWQLPADAGALTGCSAVGTQGDGFGFGCSTSGLGSLYLSLTQNGQPLRAPAAVAPNTQGTTRVAGAPSVVFTNLQPGIYWTQSPSGSSPTGFHTFSFVAGWTGANTGAVAPPKPGGAAPNAANFFYVLPMIANRNAGVPGTVYDPAAEVSWATNGNLALTLNLLPLCSGVPGYGAAPCMTASGTMTETSAAAFVNLLNTTTFNGKTGYLGQTDWTLPTFTATPNCGYITCITGGSATPQDNPKNDPLASLFYNLLGLGQWQTVDGAPSTATTDPFANFQNALYWACPAAIPANDPTLFPALAPCSPDPQCSPSSQPNPCPDNMGYAFNFGDGGSATDEWRNDLFVVPYYTDVPEPPGWAVLLPGLVLLGRDRMTRRRGQARALPARR
jgi:hypothetical protein